MQRTFLAVALLMTPTSLFADQPVPPDYSTVHIVFIVPNATAAQIDGNTPMARVGGLILPTDSIRPISIEIDDEFVGHAMAGFGTVEPVFILQSGVRSFTFSCDGFKTTSAKLKVLGTGSKQYLIVKLVADSGGASDTTESRTQNRAAPE